MTKAGNPKARLRNEQLLKEGRSHKPGNQSNTVANKPNKEKAKNQRQENQGQDSETEKLTNHLSPRLTQLTVWQRVSDIGLVIYSG